MFEPFSLHALAGWIADGLALIFALAALIHLAGPYPLLRTYRRWGYGHGFHYAVGGALALAATFLPIAETRIWGVALSGLILFLAAASLLYREKYLYAVPAMLLMIALAPAMA